MPYYGRRKWTREDDELILAQSRGQIRFSNLLTMLHSNKKTVMSRFEQLGLKPKIRPKQLLPKTYASHRDEEYEDYRCNEEGGSTDPYRIGEDRLLQRLRNYSGKRHF